MSLILRGKVIGSGLERERGSLEEREEEMRRSGDVEEEEMVVVMARHLVRTILLVNSRRVLFGFLNCIV